MTPCLSSGPPHAAWRRPFAAIAALALSLSAIAAAMPAHADDDPFADADAFARAAVAGGEVPSVAYAIARDGRVLHAAAQGEADRERGIPATVRTAYPLASLTKPITATALLTLRQRTDLSLDTPISEVLPSLAPATGAPDPLREVTISRLLHHTAGLGTYARIHFGDEIAGASSRSATAQRPYTLPMQTPGRVAEYSNLGYGLLGEVIAERSGMSFADYVRRSVFAPLKMRDAFVAGTSPHAGAVGYDATLAPLPSLWNDTPGAGNAYASVEDLLRFGAFHLAPSRVPAMRTRLPAHVVMAMRGRDADGARHPMYGEAWYGQGWYVRGAPDAPALIWHEGGMPGASVLLALYPTHGLTVTVLVNRSDAQAFVQALAERLVRATWAEAPALALDPTSGFVPLAGPSPFAGTWAGTLLVDGESRSATLRIDASGNGRLDYAAAPGETPTTREFRAIVSGPSLVSAVRGPWRSADAAEGAAALLVKLTLSGGDRLEGALVAYHGPDRLRFLLPFAIDLRRTGPP
jgi:CubicO group peptidase (beta-lactamase class C family)